MGFRDRRRQPIIKAEEILLHDEIIADEIEKEAELSVKKVKEEPEWKKILREKKEKAQALKEIQKFEREKVNVPEKKKQAPEPIKEIIIEKQKNKSEDTKLALIGTTNTANTFRSLVKRQRLTITEVLEMLLTKYIKANETSK